MDSMAGFPNNFNCSNNNKSSRDEIWNVVQGGILHLYEKMEMKKAVYMELHTHVFTYCTDMTLPQSKSTNEQGDIIASWERKKENFSTVGYDLYKRLLDFLRGYLSELVKQGTELMGDDLLTFYNKKWEEFTLCSKILNGIFGYLNRKWLASKLDAGFSLEGYKTIYEIYSLALLVWKETIYGTLHGRVTTAILELIKRERNVEIVNTSLIKSVIKSYVDLGREDECPTFCPLERSQGQSSQGPYLFTYQEHFETLFINETENFYRNESLAFLQQNTVTEYMKKVEQRLIEEQKRVEFYLHGSTLEKLMKTCDTVLIQNQLEVLHNELKNLLDEEKTDDIGRMYMLVGRLEDALGEMIAQLERYVCTLGMTTLKELCDNNGANDPKMYVCAILDIYNKYSTLVLVAFKKDKKFEKSLDIACANFINKNAVVDKAAQTNKVSNSKSSELIARYCDLLLKKSSKNPEEQELEDVLDQVMIVFKYLENKDVFENFYSKLLASRLIAQTSTSNEAESSMIAKLKHACGTQYVSTLQQMFQDVELSKDVNEKFKDYLKKKEDIDIIPFTFSVQVLSCRHWPLKQFEFALPSELVTSVDKFTVFYSSAFGGRKLSWIYNASRGEMTTNCFKNRYVFVLSTFQMAVLLMFNSNTSYRVGDLAEATQLSMNVLVQILQIFVKAKLLLLPNGMNEKDSVHVDTTVTLFTGYNNKKLRVNLNVPLKEEVKQQQEETYAAIQDSRKFAIQAAIVRIMKMRKTCQHQNLLAEVIEQLAPRFKPPVPVIKNCIEMLIHKEYLDRSEERSDTYTYRA